jgi:hypothetical protein
MITEPKASNNANTKAGIWDEFGPVPCTFLWSAQEEITEIRSDSSVKTEFNESELEGFWIRGQLRHPSTAKVALAFLIPFTSTYHSDTAWPSLLITETLTGSDFQSKLCRLIEEIPFQILQMIFIHCSKICDRILHITGSCRKLRVGHSSRSKAWTSFARSDAGIMGSNPIQGMDVWCVYAFILCLCCPVFR